MIYLSDSTTGQHRRGFITPPNRATPCLPALMPWSRWADAVNYLHLGEINAACLRLHCDGCCLPTAAGIMPTTDVTTRCEACRVR